MNEIESVVVEETKVWQIFDRGQIEQIIQGNIRSMDEKMGQLMDLFITSGYYLRRQYQEKQYLDAGYDRFEDYVKERYGRSRSWATRMMQINEKYSIDGNDPRLDPKYKGYGISQLQEMLSLTDEQREQVSPDMTVKEIRALKAPEPEEEEQITGQMSVEDFPEVMPEQSDQEETEDDDELLCDTCVNASSLTGDPDLCQNCTEEGSNYRPRCITGKSGSGYCGAAAYCNEPVNCCAACENKCNSQCGWLEEEKKPEPEIDFKTLDKMIAGATSQKESDFPCDGCVHDAKGGCNYPETPDDYCVLGDKREEDAGNQAADPVAAQPNEVIDAEYTEVTEEITITPQSLLVDAKKWLEDYIKCDAPKNLIEKQKIYVAALAGMVCDLEEVEPEAPEQPELPVMKNNEQRKEWLKDYKAWGVWYYDEHIDVYYYKYDFDNGDRLIVAEYPNRGAYWYGDDKKYTEKHYHLIQQARECHNGGTYFHKFTHAPDSETYLVDYLKRVARG